MSVDPHPGILSSSISVINKYIYAENNPIALSDPTGLISLGSIGRSIGHGIDWASRKTIDTLNAYVKLKSIVFDPLYKLDQLIRLGITIYKYAEYIGYGAVVIV